MDSFLHTTTCSIHDEIRETCASVDTMNEIIKLTKNKIEKGRNTVRALETIESEMKRNITRSEPLFERINKLDDDIAGLVHTVQSLERYVDGLCERLST